MARRFRLCARLAGAGASVAAFGSSGLARSSDGEDAPTRRFVAGTHFKLLMHEKGQVGDVPVWEPTPSVVPFSDSAMAVARMDIPNVPGAFLLSNVLTQNECSTLSCLAESMGFNPDAPITLERNDIRRNKNCLIIADDSMWQPIWQRVKDSVPPTEDGGAAAGLNQRWRLYRYEQDGVFRAHIDNSWPGSAVRDGILEDDAFGDRWSKLTLLIYLDDAETYGGGETTLFAPGATPMREALRKGWGIAELTADGGQLVRVKVPQGWALCFYHGEHEHSTLHEGSRVTSGVKRIIRSDVLYYLPGRGPPPAPPENVARVEGCPNVGNPHHMCNEYCRRMYGAPSASSSV